MENRWATRGTSHIAPKNKGDEINQTRDTSHTAPKNKHHEINQTRDTSHITPKKKDHEINQTRDTSHITPKEKDHEINQKATNTRRRWLLYYGQTRTNNYFVPQTEQDAADPTGTFIYNIKLANEPCGHNWYSRLQDYSKYDISRQIF